MLCLKEELPAVTMVDTRVEAYYIAYDLSHRGTQVKMPQQASWQLKQSN